MALEIGLVVLVSVLALLGGIVSYLKGRLSRRLTGSGMELAVELITAALAGWSMYFLGVWQRWPEPLVCLMVIASTHNGAAVIGLLAASLVRFLKSAGQPTEEG